MRLGSNRRRQPTQVPNSLQLFNSRGHIWNKCRDHSMIREQYLLQWHISRHANLNLGSCVDRLHILKHCHGNNHIRYSDQCQQARSLAVPWALCRQTGNANTYTLQSWRSAIRKKDNSCSKLPRLLRHDILDLRRVHQFSRVVFSDVLCRSHFGLK